MKNRLLPILLMCALCLSGCALNQTAETAVTPVTVQNPAPGQTQTPEASGSAGYAVDVPGIVDLTALSSTMVYAEVFNMVCAPEDYIGRTVKMAGQFAASEDADTGMIRFSCMIADATACCRQGLEFMLASDAVYPDDYPAPGTEITVTGVFETYEEGGYTYCRLADAEMVI